MNEIDVALRVRFRVKKFQGTDRIGRSLLSHGAVIAGNGTKVTHALIPRHHFHLDDDVDACERLYSLYGQSLDSVTPHLSHRHNRKYELEGFPEGCRPGK